MRTFPDLRFRELSAQVARAQQLLDQSRFEEARQAFGELRVKADRIGVSSGFVEWGLAVASDQLGDLPRAYEHIVNAIRADPLDLAFQNSFNIVMNRLRAALADPKRAPEDPSTAELYRMLVAAGEADVPSHLAMARHLAATGRHGEAMKLLDAVTLLAPISRDAWVQKGSLARAMGDLALAATCEAEAGALSVSDVPFGIPSPRAAC